MNKINKTKVIAGIAGLCLLAACSSEESGAPGAGVVGGGLVFVAAVGGRVVKRGRRG